MTRRKQHANCEPNLKTEVGREQTSAKGSTRKYHLRFCIAQWLIGYLFVPVLLLIFLSVSALGQNYYKLECPVNVTVPVGDSFPIRLLIANEQPVGGFSCVLKYDRDDIEVISIEAGTDPHMTGEAHVFLPKYYPEENIAVIGWLNLNPFDPLPIQSPGAEAHIATIWIRILPGSTGGCIDFVLTDRNPYYSTITFQAGSVSVLPGFMDCDNCDINFTIGQAPEIVPIVLVHGWRSNPSVWGDDNTGMVSWLKSDFGPYVWPAFLWPCGSASEVGFKDEPLLMFRGNAIELSAFIELRISQMSPEDRVRVKRIDVIAHSMGGLVTRRYMHKYFRTNDTWTVRPIRNLIMLGTPNSGSLLGSKLAKFLLCPSGPAGEELDGYYMTKFNQLFGSLNQNTEFWPVYGYGGCEIVGNTEARANCPDYPEALQLLLGCPNDGLVTKTSVVGTMPDGNHLFNGSAAIFLCHSDFPGSLALYNSFIRPVLSLDKMYYPVVLPSLEDYGVPQTSYDFDSTITGGSIVTKGFQIEGNSDVAVVLLPSDPNLTLTLTSPTGISFDSTSSTPDSSVTYDRDSSGVRAFHFSNAEAGAWQYHLDATQAGPSILSWEIVVVTRNGIRLEFTQSSMAPNVGSTLTLKCHAVDGVSPLSNLAGTALPIQNETDTLAPITFFDDGAHDDGFANDGDYSALFQVTDFGSIEFAINFQGASSLGTFKRMSSLYSYSRSYVCGDVDEDGNNNISDVVYLIKYIFGGGPQPIVLKSGDVDCNDIVTISDAVYLINYIFGGGASPCGACL